MELIDEAGQIFKQEGQLINKKDTKDLVFVGDTHGDFETSKKIIESYLGNYRVVFLGDYVDRGPKSKENIDFLLNKKVENPDELFLLQGNHEGLKYHRFGPADFWNNLNRKKRDKYREVLGKLPLIFSQREIIASHGALPEIKEIEKVENIKYGRKEWKKTVWGDFSETESEKISSLGRPLFGPNYFNKVMKNLKKDILVRSHQPSAPLFMYEKKCITILSSSAYSPTRRIAILKMKPQGYQIKIRQI